MGLKISEFKIINLKDLCRESGTDQFKLRNNINGMYDSLTVNEKTALANALFLKVRKVFIYLGFDITMKRVNLIPKKAK